MPDVVRLASRLQRRLHELETLHGQRPLSPAESSALAECAFRIAVDRATAPEQAATLLQHAVRLDRSNPKFHYHLGRLCFSRGELDSAAAWLERARRLCPTSHRIWTHIGLLQREINERYADSTDFVHGDHKRRWKEISQLVLSGNDAFDAKLADFEPRKIAPADTTPAGIAVAAVADAGGEMPVQRFLGAGTCRWTTINDLIADDLLETEPGERGRNALRQHLERSVAASSCRGGHAAFAILAAEWLLRGYPVAFIQRIRPADMPARGPSAVMLDTIIELLAAEPAAVSEGLAAALRERKIPPLVAAVIHRSHIIGASPSLNKLVVDLHGARMSLKAKPGADEVAVDWIRALQQDAKALEPRPRAPIPDFPAEQAIADATPEETVAEARRQLQECQARLQTARDWLMSRKDADAAALPPDDIVEANRIRAFLKRLREQTTKAVNAMARLRVSGKAAGFSDTIADLEHAWQNLTAQSGPLTRLVKRYSEVDVPEEAENAAAPLTAAQRIDAWRNEAVKLAGEIGEWRARIAANAAAEAEAEGARDFLRAVEERSKAILEGSKQLRDSGELDVSAVRAIETAEQAVQNLKPLIGPIRKLLSKIPVSKPPVETAAAQSENKPAEAPPQPPRQQLASLVEELETRVRGTFNRALSTFDAYSPAQRRTPYLQAVRLSVRARRGETMYRLGRRDEARRDWSGILAEDALDLDMLQNIAVCDSRSGNLQRCLDAWRSLASMFYFRDVCAADPAVLAARRAELHQNLGNAYAPRGFRQSGDKRRELTANDRDEIAAFFLSAPRVRLFMRHQIMALLSRRLALHTAPMILGMSRSASEEERNAARRKMETWIDRVSAYLPRRVGPPFREMAAARLAAAAEQMKSARQMRDLADSTTYKDEQKNYFAWLADIVKWKFHLLSMLELMPDPAVHPELLDPLVEICALDEIPIDTSEELLAATTLELKISYKPDIIATIMARGAREQTTQLLHFVFPKAGEDDDAIAPMRAAVYRRLTGELISRSVVSEVLEILDCPTRFDAFRDLYPPEVERIFDEKNAEPSEEAIAAMRRLYERYPLSASIAYDYAGFLAMTGKRAEAKAILEKAVRNALHENGRKLCEPLLKQLSA